MKKLIICLLALLWTHLAGAQAYPNRTIRLIVPFPAGGTVDTLARKTASAMEASLKQAIVIDNRPGANGIIGVEAAVNSPPDGYTMLFNSSAMIINQIVYPNIRYDTLRDLVPVSEAMSLDSYVLLVNASSPYRNIDDLLEAARQKSNALSYATPGVGNGQHLLMETVNYKAGVKMTHVPYKGIPEMVTSLMRGDVDSMFLNPLLAESHVKAGKFRVIAYMGKDKTRSPAMPDVPAVAESRFLPGFTWTGSRFGFFFPAGTPASLVNQMQAEVNKALQHPDLRAYLNAGGFTVVGGTPAQFSQVITSDLKRYAEIARASNIRAE